MSSVCCPVGVVWRTSVDEPFQVVPVGGVQVPGEVGRGARDVGAGEVDQAVGLDRVRAYVEADESPSPDEITSAFWGACHGGHLLTARYLHERGADSDWCGYDGMTPLDIARAQDADDVVRWLCDLGAKAAPRA